MCSTRTASSVYFSSITTVILISEVEIMETRPSKSRPYQGMVKVKTTTLNQNGEPVQVSIGNLVVPRRSSAP